MSTNKVNVKLVSSMVMLILIKQHQRNIWSSIHEKVKQHWGWVEKNVAYIRKCICENKKLPYEIWRFSWIKLIDRY